MDELKRAIALIDSEITALNLKRKQLLDSLSRYENELRKLRTEQSLDKWSNIKFDHDIQVGDVVCICMNDDDPEFDDYGKFIRYVVKRVIHKTPTKVNLDIGTGELMKLGFRDDTSESYVVYSDGDVDTSSAYMIDCRFIVLRNSTIIYTNWLKSRAVVLFKFFLVEL
jgi:hypothetical protein